MEERDVAWACELDALLFPDAAWGEEEMREAFLPGRRFIVAEKGERLGWAAMDVRGARAHILSIDVEPRSQGQGVGSSLLFSLLSSARKLEKGRCVLEASCSNAPALALYEKFGFRAKGRVRGYYPSSDAFIMEKDLD
ncbi:MAG: GNAT family N-acetyltransferase [Aeriscardovia sp.]|nr:GNAT family N-acetyltransferase [Aeriscardovia sp.]